MQGAAHSGRTPLYFQARSFTGAPFPPFHREYALIIQSANLSLRGTGDRREGSLFRITLPLSSVGGL